MRPGPEYTAEVGGAGGIAEPLDAAPEVRLRCLLAVCCLPLVVVVWRVADVQGAMDARAATEAVRLRTRVEAIDARDGTIRTVDGVTLAGDVPAYEVAVHYRWLESEPDRDWLDRRAREAVRAGEAADRAAGRRQVAAAREELWRRLGELTGDADGLGRKRASIERRVTRVRDDVLARRREKAEPAGDVPVGFWRTLFPDRRSAREDRLVVAEELDHHPVLTVSDEVAAEIGRAGLPGVRLTESRRRDWPAWTPGHLIGPRLVSGGHEPTSGDFGLERAFDRRLAGVPGERVVRTDRDGAIARVEPVRDSRPGGDLTLTIEEAVQRRVAAACDALPFRGAVVVLDVTTGAVAAVASRPTFDLDAASRRDGRFWERVEAEPGGPLFDRALRGRYRLGAVALPFLVAGAIDAGELSAAAEFRCGSGGRCHAVRATGFGHGRLRPEEAIAVACGGATAGLVEGLGDERAAAIMADFGFGRPYETDLPGVSRGTVGDADGAPSAQAWRVTPVEVARAVAALANGGVLPTPHVVAGFGVRTVGDRGEGPSRPSVSRAVDAVGDEAAEVGLRGLRRAVVDPAGCGREAFASAGVDVSGMVAEVSDGVRSTARAVAVWPAAGPRYAAAVVAEEAPGEVAAEIASAVIGGRERLSY